MRQVPKRMRGPRGGREREGRDLLSARSLHDLLTAVPEEAAECEIVWVIRIGHADTGTAPRVDQIGVELDGICFLRIPMK